MESHGCAKITLKSRISYHDSYKKSFQLVIIIIWCDEQYRFAKLIFTSPIKPWLFYFPITAVKDVIYKLNSNQEESAPFYSTWFNTLTVIFILLSSLCSILWHLELLMNKEGHICKIYFVTKYSVNAIYAYFAAFFMVSINRSTWLL